MEFVINHKFLMGYINVNNFMKMEKRNKKKLWEKSILLIERVLKNYDDDTCFGLYPIEGHVYRFL